MSSPLTAASPPLLLDEGHHVLGRVLVGGRVGQRAADVVDDDLGPFAGQEECFLTSDAPSGSGDDGHLAVEQSHVLPPS